MKSTGKYILLLAFLAGLLTSSCNKDNGTTLTISRSSLPGTWTVTESKKKATYEVTIRIDSASSNGVLIRNFGGAGLDVEAIAYLSGTKLSLNSNELLTNGWIVNGTGTFTSATVISWPYTIHDGANTNTFQAVFTKK
jgi:hypothetical protein